ncbi:entry exclusion lipoprotein TrbK [Luteimonas kalidii]|uniref:Entry exclusion lipoprotein TrbK n=1 Tax=Luteimonas kalidii TaxID=3042025 RepID=A0ABT6JXC7_9GAMM|nr:entry exclusion lipoprotein TrbK [Luteimonas kalidii]MDH5835354.1 entry exclusion lipoprotein TrbK [Luteimonas kalidii]
MRTSSLWVILALLGGCGSGAPPQPMPEQTPSLSAELVEELVRDPERLKEVRRLCREDWQAISEELCIASVQATRRRFMGDGGARYTSGPIELSEPGRPTLKE